MIVDSIDGYVCTESHVHFVPRVAAYAMLNDFVVLRRRAAAKEVAAAAQASDSGGPMLQNFPEFMLPYIIQVFSSLLPILAFAEFCSFFPELPSDVLTP